MNSPKPLSKPKRIQNRKALDEVKHYPCLVCRAPSDPCHIKSRGAGGDDTLDNLIQLCRRHHSEQHQTGWVGFLAKYPMVWEHFEKKGWELQTILGRTRLVRVKY